MSVPRGLGRIGADAARRLERNGLRATGRLKLPRASEEEIAALSGLLGTRWRAPLPGADTSVDLAVLDEALVASGSSLLAFATAVRGAPLVEAGAARRVQLAHRDAGWISAFESSAVRWRPGLRSWLERERSTGALLRTGVADPFALLHETLQLLSALPADPPISLVRFAAAHCGGDPHALDRDRHLDALLRRALAHLDGDPAPLTTAPARRERYERWGLACDELSSTVLTLGLQPTGEGALEHRLRLAVGEPQVLTLRELTGVRELHCGPSVFTCENPDVLAAAADELGAACPPFVCTEGWPSAACLRLLGALRTGGAAMHHHGDMDPAGLRILDHLIAHTGGAPWRMTAEDHAAHAAGGVEVELGARIAVTAPGLLAVGEAITASGRLVREEQTVRDLIAELALRMRQPGLRTSVRGSRT